MLLTIFVSQGKILRLLEKNEGLFMISRLGHGFYLGIFYGFTNDAKQVLQRVRSLFIVGGQGMKLHGIWSKVGG